MDQRSVSMSSRCFEDICLPAERQVGFWKQNTMPDHHDGMVQIPGSKMVASSSLEKILPVGSQSVDCSETPQFYAARDQMEKLHNGGKQGTDDLLNTSSRFTNRSLKTGTNLNIHLASCGMDGNRTDINGAQYESSLFSSSFSEIFSRKLRLPVNNVLSHQSVDTVASHYEDVEPFESDKEIEAQNIRNLLPDEEDLFSGVIEELGCNTTSNNGNDVEDFDLFSSSGGMELEVDDRTCAGYRVSESSGRVLNGQVDSNGSAMSQRPYGEHPSRTLFVRNINSSIDDSVLRNLFQKYGEIRTLYTVCKHRGFVMISYYDIRSARDAMKALQNKPLGRRKLDIHYSIPKDNPSEKDINQGTLVVFNLDSSVTNDDIRELFSVHGEIKEIRETPYQHHQKFIEFYDVRDAEAAFHALNRYDIAGKRIKLEPSRPGGARRSMQQGCSELEQGEPSMSQSLDDNSSSKSTVSPGVTTSHCIDNESIQGLQSAIQLPIDPFSENGFPHGSSGVSNTLHCSVRGTSIGNQYSLGEPNYSSERVKFGNQGIPSSHPHCLPEYCDNLGNVIPYNSLSTIADTAGSNGAKITEGADSRHISGVVSNGQAVELNGGVIGCSGNGNSPLHGHHSMWRNSNSYQHHPSGSMIWPNSPSLVNSVHAHRPPHLTGIPRAQPHMVNIVSSVHHHHIGSAPAVNPSIWERRHAYAGESPEASSFHLGSLGSLGFPVGSPLLPLDIASHNIFSHVGGTCIDISPSAGLRSPQQMCHIFPGRNPIMSVPASYDSHSERMRSFLHRRNEVNSSHADKKQYELDIDRILRGEDSRTTLMIKNIPNKYTSKMLLAAIDEHHRGTYDFIYLPIDFKNKCNVGYAFINMIDPLQIISFHQTFNGKKWEKFNSEKVATLAYARIQGKAALIAHFQNSSLMNEDKRCRPILFHTDGPNAGDQEPFPVGTNIRSRPGKPRAVGNEENHHHHQGSPSSSANGEESSNRTDSSLGSTKDMD
ncbi:protein MEI2-like 4 isoform X2 [Malania oleifera]|uniref:protein MEI2-like 4 isoform X2 n=1 Tax=Malania oleifera TaxID=397392 RepID=UPI0025AE3E16|nr:protein MEI2-like 4 isoform X2 [Malania oleifera]